MKILAVSVFAMSVVASAASAAQSTLTDVQYIKASRCAGIAKTLTNVVDSEQLAALVKSERGVRADYVVGRAGDAFEQGRKEAKKEARRENLTAELTGSCAALLGGEATLAKR
jgi:hypothetical protein